MENSKPNLRWPAEWEHQEAIWFSWPHRTDTWKTSLDEIENNFTNIINTIANYQKVRINAANYLWSKISKNLTNIDNIELFDHKTNDVWCRDHGSTFVTENNSLKAVDWTFNAWGGKFPPWDLDDQVAKKMAQSIGAKHDRSNLTIEGGAIEGNGKNLILTTEAVALNANRNPDWSKSDIEKELQQKLGTQKVFWLPSGIEGDDTDGHIDDLTRFVSEDAVVSISEKNSLKPNYQLTQQNLEILQDLKTVSGSSVELIELPLPEPLKAKNWRLETLPASYANFLILNELVLVPSFDQHKNDDRAQGILRECFSSREVIPIDCLNLIHEGGAIHCISQQQPSVE